MTENHDLHDEHISRLYRMGSRREPSAHIDQEIIQAAHQTSTGRKRSYTWPSLATAAVLILSLSLVLKILDQQPLEESVMGPIPGEMNGGVIAPVEEKELEERAASMSDEKDEAKVPAPAPIQTKPSTIAPAMKDIAPLRKTKPKLESAPAAEMYRSPVAPADTPTAGKIQSLGSGRKQSTPTRHDRMEQELRQQKQRRKFDLQAVPDSMLQAPARKKKQDHCADVAMPNTDSVTEWQQYYRTAMLKGDRIAAICLQQEFQTRFRKPLPVEELK